MSQVANTPNSDPIATGYALAAIALGSNLGPSLATVQAAVERLSQTADMVLIAQSPWYRTAAVGPPQPDYVNGCVGVQTRRSPQGLLQILLEIEQVFGRVRAERWGPRTLDLDLLLYEDLVLDTPTLTLPHPHLTERAFVLVPLADIVPNWVHPVTGLTIRQHCDHIDISGVDLWS
ncbi:MAG: 2-amino-4-hydroxy-6-hydroxymethyldihydropteridine diphosphokinase [Thermosynechococcaceae cyanobacterium]